MSDETTSLPSSWERTTIGAVASVNPAGSTVSVDDDRLVTFLPMAAVEELTGRVDLTTSRRFGEVKKGFTRFRNGDVLLAKITPSMENGKVAVVDDLLGGVGCGSTEFHVIRPEPGITPDYLRYFIIRSAFRREAKRNMQGAVGQQRVPTEFVRGAELPLAPSAEQERIVSMLEELFSHIEEGERALERVQMLVERYRQSVLKAAVTGELTREWREQRKGQESGEALLERILQARREAWEKAELDRMKAKGNTPADDDWKRKYEEPLPPDITDIPELPEGWVWASMDQVGIVSGGLTKNQKRDEHALRRPYLRVANVYANRLDLTEVHQIGVGDSELDRVVLYKDDLLVVEGNGSVDQIGRVALWDGSVEGCVHQNHLIKVRCTAALPSLFVLVWCMSPLGRSYIRRVASSTAGLHTLSISKVQMLPVPIPTAGELTCILDRFAEMDSLVTSQRHALRAETRRAASLRQSVLRAAFSGQLVPQDLSDEPASALLERIAAERPNITSTPKRGSRKHARTD